MKTHYLLLSLLAATAFVPTIRAEDAPAAAPAADDEKIEPGVLKGKVTTQDGKPLVGAVVNVENQMFISQADIRIKKDGKYRRELTIGSWKPRATITKEYDDQTYKFDLCPDDPDEVDGKAGGVVNFTWKLSGKKPDPMLGYFGSPVIAYTEGGYFDVDLLNVVLTLEPAGPLIDGSAGKTITKPCKPTGDGPGIEDVPFGHYKISAKTKDGKPLNIRVRNTDDKEYKPSVTTGFINNKYINSIHMIEVEVHAP